jgi:polyketide synthase PksN
MVIEEYLPGNKTARAPIPIDANNPILFVLSAKNSEQLRIYARDMKLFIESHKGLDLVDMAYTLQVGREYMDQRLAIPADSRETLLKALEGFIGNHSRAVIFTGRVEKGKGEAAVVETAEEASVLLENPIREKNLKKAARLWVKGLPIDWNLLYSAIKPRSPRKINLPTYPFARESYWLPVLDTPSDIPAKVPGAAVLHPLLQQNTSTLREQRFSSTFTGREFFLADHVVKGQRVLPGVAYLEMVRAAVEQAARDLAEGTAGIRLKNVAWPQPLAVEAQPVQVHIRLFPGDEEEIAFEIYSEPGDVETGPMVHCQGSAAFIPGEGAAGVLPLDLAGLRARCSRTSLSSDQCRDIFRAMGIQYGPAHRGIEQVLVGERQVLAKLSLPSTVSPTAEQFVLHPSLMDSALQASIGLVMGPGGSPFPGNSAVLKPTLPFALQELELFNPCTSAMWALVSWAGGSPAGDKVRKLDIDLSDETGRICVRMKGLSARVSDPASRDEILVLRPGWKEQAAAGESPAPTYTQHLILACEPFHIPGEIIAGKMKGVRCLSRPPGQDGIAESFQSGAVQLLTEIQRTFKDKSIGKVLIQVLVSTRGEEQMFSGLSGLLKTAALENPKLVGQVIEVEPGEDPQEIAAKLEENSRCPRDNRVRYQDGKRWVADWTRAAVSRETGPIPWKDRGIYLITGGMGGLGLIFAQEIARQVKDVTLVLAGRTPLEALGKEKQDRLNQLQALGIRVEYRPAEVTDPGGNGPQGDGIGEPGPGQPGPGS